MTDHPERKVTWVRGPAPHRTAATEEELHRWVTLGAPPPGLAGIIEREPNPDFFETLNEALDEESPPASTWDTMYWTGVGWKTR